MNRKRFNTFFIRWVQFRVGAIPYGCNSTSTLFHVLNIDKDQFKPQIQIKYFPLDKPH